MSELADLDQQLFAQPYNSHRCGVCRFIESDHEKAEEWNTLLEERTPSGQWVRTATHMSKLAIQGCKEKISDQMVRRHRSRHVQSE